jgi:hypothetical protein
MTPEEAANFYEDDEDPEALIAKFDAAPKGITVRPATLVHLLHIRLVQRNEEAQTSY